MDPLLQIDPAVWRALAGVVAMFRETNVYPLPESIFRIAASEDADRHAVLVLALGVVPLLGCPGHYVSLGKGIGPGLVPTRQCAWAVVSRGKTYQGLRTPRGVALPGHQPEQLAEKINELEW